MHTRPSFIPELGTYQRVPRTLSIEAFLSNVDETDQLLPGTLSREAFLSNVNETLQNANFPNNENFPNPVIIPIPGIPLNPNTRQPIAPMSPGCIINIPLTPEQLERQQRINDALQIRPCRKVLIAFCIGLTSTWLLGASVMAIMHVADSN